jgi:nitrogenase-stabilizing/protective protein
MFEDDLLEDDLEELSSAEDFLQYFEVEYDQKVVHVNRLHILQRFHNYLSEAEDGMPEYEEAKREVYKQLLEKAYQDFVDSDAATEKVLKVYRMQEPQETFVSLDQLVK